MHDTWAFRIKVKLGPTYRWSTSDPEASRVEIVYLGAVVTVKSDSGSPLVGSEWVTFVGRGFGSAQEASRTGRSLQAHLRVAAVWSNMPMDVGETDEVLSALGPGAPIPTGWAVLPNVHGLWVFKDTGRDLVFSGNATVQVSRSVDVLADHLGEVEAYPPPHRDGHLARACDFYIAAQFLVDPRSQFLMLISSLEQLAEQRPRPPEVVQHVDEWIRQAATVADRDQRTSLLSGLAYLKSESIGASVRAVVARHVRATDEVSDPVKFTTACYTIRSDLAHGNKYVPVAEVKSSLPDLCAIVREAIKGSISAASA